MKVVFFDLETTETLVNKHGIHQISGMIVIDGEVKETFEKAEKAYKEAK